MTQPEKMAADEKARKALAETLRKARSEAVAHIEGDNPPRIVRDMVEDLIDLIDAQVEELTTDRDDAIDEAVEGLGR